jgi:flagellar biosynthesis component FlhA
MKVFGLIFIIIIVASLAIYFTIYDSNKIDKLHNDYNIVTINDEFIGKITDLFTSKGASFVVLSDSMKIRFHTSKNSKYLGKKAYLDGVLSIGDTLVKNKGTDTLIVKKQNQKYYYVLGRFINRKK